MSRKSARNRDHQPDPARKARCKANRAKRRASGFLNRHEDQGHAKESKKAKAVPR